MSEESQTTPDLRPQQIYQGGELQFFRADDAVTLYVSSVRIMTSPFEFIFVVGQVDAGVKDDPPRIKETATIFMSPQHAKSFADILLQKVAEYEANVGPLPTGGFTLTAEGTNQEE